MSDLNATLARDATPADSSPTRRPRPPPSRRRDKPQLSCDACRRRKVRCDRLHPCSNCSSRGLGYACSYPAARMVSSSPLGGGSTYVQGRINQLEELVVSLMQQTNSGPRAPPSDHSPAAAPDEGSPPKTSESAPPAVPEPQHQVPPSPSDYGSIRIRETSVSYVGNAHWAAVLDSIADLRDHFEGEDEAHAPRVDSTRLQAAVPPRPQLLYDCSGNETLTSIIDSLPPRPAVDRLVSRYFNDLDVATGVVHRGKFLREYEEFWNAPQSASIMWVGLLFAMISLSTQFQQTFLAPANGMSIGEHSTPSLQVPGTQTATDIFREGIIRCLKLGHYAKGGPYVLETLILYFLVEILPLKEVDIGIWVLVGTIVQVATHMGYHRDPTHFPGISPFAAEMRRRVWAMIIQLDFSISTQMGLPPLVKEGQTDTSEPRNLADSDFDELTENLPPSRPEDEVTPILYTLAKLRILRVGVRVADLATSPRPYSYDTVMELDKEVAQAQEALPSSMKWESLASSLTSPPLVLMQRIWLEIFVQRLKIVLHKKFLAPPRSQRQYTYSRSACLNAAMKILEFHHLVDEETQLEGRLYQVRWRVSTACTHEFLLATSVLCLYLQVCNEEQGEGRPRQGASEPGPVERIRQLLRVSQGIWLRLSAESTEARKAAAALRYVLGDSASGLSDVALSMPAATAPYFTGFMDIMPGYHFPSLGPEPTTAGLAWPRFGSYFSNDIM